MSLAALHDRIERATGFVFGLYRSPAPDFRFVIRVGGGKGKSLCNFEVGILGRSFYLDRVGR